MVTHDPVRAAYARFQRAFANASSSWIDIHDDFPADLRFLEPQLIRLMRQRIRIIFLQKKWVPALAMKSAGMTTRAGRFPRSMSTGAGSASTSSCNRRSCRTDNRSPCTSDSARVSCVQRTTKHGITVNATPRITSTIVLDTKYG
jgi:hypothetical protein